MDLKSIKDIQQQITKLQLRSGGRALTTGSLLPEFENSGRAILADSSLPSHLSKGLRAEVLVTQKLSQKYHQIFHRLKTPFAELDLGFLTPTGSVLVVEVKACAYEGFQGPIVARKQRMRIERALEYLRVHLRRPVEFQLALVDARGGVELVEDGVLGFWS